MCLTRSVNSYRLQMYLNQYILQEIHPSIDYLNCNWVACVLEPVPAVIGQKEGCPMERSQVYLRADI